MLTVLVKSSFFFIGSLLTYSLLSIPVLLAERGFVPIMAMLLPVWISSAVIFAEREECYGLLRTLPVTDEEIVGAKFLLALLEVSIASLFTVFLAVRVAVGGPVLRPNLALILLSAVLSLLAAACWYAGIWRFGSSVMTDVVIAFMGVAAVTAIAVGFGPPGSPTPQSLAHDFVLVRLLAAAPWWAFVLLALLAVLVYYALMRLAVSIKRMSEVHA